MLLRGYWYRVEGTLRYVLEIRATSLSVASVSMQTRLLFVIVVIHCMSPESISQIYGITRIDWKSI